MQVLLPFALVSKLKWFVIPTSFLSSIVYFTIDDCAAEMETPFGEDENVRAAEPREGRTRSLHLSPAPPLPRTSLSVMLRGACALAQDVDIDKLTRRIDKHTAAMVGLWSGKPALNYDVFPDTNSQHVRGPRADTSPLPSGHPLTAAARALRRPRGLAVLTPSTE